MTVAYICGCGEPVHYERPHACKVGVESATREGAESKGVNTPLPPLAHTSTPSTTRDIGGDIA